LKTSIYLLHNKDKVKINKKNFVKVDLYKETYCYVQPNLATHFQCSWL